MRLAYTKEVAMICSVILLTNQTHILLPFRSWKIIGGLSVFEMCQQKLVCWKSFYFEVALQSIKHQQNSRGIENTVQ